MKNYKKVNLEDLRSITKQEFESAVRICQTISNIEKDRCSYVQKYNLDTDIFLPQANWAQDDIRTLPNPIYELYRTVLASEYETINNLRLYTQPFTGYHLNNLLSEESSINPQCSYVNLYNTVVKYLPSEIIVRPPKMLGEIGWDVNGNIVNHDVYVYQERMNCLYESGIVNWLNEKAKKFSCSNIVEIGGGFGGLAHHIKNAVPKTNYFICDLPESLLFSALYLKLTQPQYTLTIYDGSNKSDILENNGGFKLIPNHMFSEFVESTTIDLAINTLSLSEMSEKQVRYYAKSLRAMLNRKGVFFEQNTDNRHIDGLNYCKDYLFEEFPFSETLVVKSVPSLTQGVVDIWSNQPLSSIINKSFKPNIRSDINQSQMILNVRRIFFINLKRILGSQLYVQIRDVWRSLRYQNKEIERLYESQKSAESDGYIQWICQILGGWLCPGHGNIAAFDYGLKNMPENGAVIEIGSFLGLSTNIIAYLTAKHNRNNQFFSCDPWLFEGTEKPIGGYFDASTKEYRDYAKKVFQMNLETFSAERKPYAIESLSNEFFELWHSGATAKDVFDRTVKLGGDISFAYIDGAHTYEAAKADFLGVHRHLLSGGFILFDDSGDDSPFECRKVISEVLTNPSYELISKSPNYFFRKK